MKNNSEIANLRKSVALAVIVVGIGCAVGIYALNSLSKARRAASLTELTHHQKEIDKNARIFCREYTAARIQIRIRAVAQKRTLNLIWLSLKDIKDPKFHHLGVELNNLNKTIKIIPIPACPL